MIKHFKVSWYEYYDPSSAHGQRVKDLLIDADTGSRAKATATKILGKTYIQVMGVRNMKAEIWPCYKGGR